MATDKEFEEFERNMLLDLQGRQIIFNSIIAFATCIIALVGIFQIVSTYIHDEILILFFSIPMGVLVFFVIAVMFGNKSSFYR